MSLKLSGVIPIPDAAGTLFDHGAVDPVSGRVFIAHTAKNRVEVVDSRADRHVATLPGFAEAAGVVADDGQVLVTNRGAASLAWVDARTLETLAVLPTGPRPNGVAIVAHRRLAIVACIGDDSAGPTLEAIDLVDRQRWSIALPGRPRWCVTDTAGTRVFLAIREPSMILVARLPRLDAIDHWRLPAAGAHGLDIDQRTGLLYVACDAGALVELDSATGAARRQWKLVGGPDATFFNPTSGRVHVAIGNPGLVQSFDPGTGAGFELATAPGIGTTALISPDRLYAFSPTGEVLVLSGA